MPTDYIGLRPVHDIIALTNKQHTKRAAVAFIQHGTVDDGWNYENVCVFCGLTVGYVEDKEDKLGYGDLERALYDQVNTHMSNCKAGGHRFAVYVTQRPLNVEKKVVEH